MGSRIILNYLLIFFIILSISFVFAENYNYNQKIPIKSDSEQIGYVKPYTLKIFGVDYTYLEWQRYGFPIGYSFPIYLVEGTTTALPFGIKGELLRVKIGDITKSGVDLIIKQSDIKTEIEDIDENLPKNIEAIQEDIEERVEPVINEINHQLEKFNRDIGTKINKAIQRDYHSSLHIIDLSNSKLKQISLSIKNKEAELAEEIADSVVSSVINIFGISAGIIGGGLSYSALIKQIPSEVRHEITNFVYNIEDNSDDIPEASLADKGIATLYIGNPTLNKVSSQFNQELKAKGLPYFEGNKIIGKRVYSSEDIGIIAAIPEETYWDENTLQNRWDNDRIRLYKTLIAGIGNNGLDAAALWYNSQLDLAKNSISGAIRLAGGAVDDAGIEIGEISSSITKNIETNPKASIGFSTIAQGWVLTAVSSLQEADFKRIDSLGYVVIVQKQGNSFKTLETYSLVGNKKNLFLDEYQEIANKIGDIAEATKEKATNTITGGAIGAESEDDNENTKEGNVISRFFKNIWRKLFG